MSESRRSKVVISHKPFDLVDLNRQVQSSHGENGAAVVFTGCVRVADEEVGLTGMTLEHYPGMTESLLEDILVQAVERWQLTQALAAHRVGHLIPGETIVFVGTCALHRKQAFEAAEFIMDYLKNKATFWKKEHYSKESDRTDRWVDAKQSDSEALKRWQN